MSIVPNVQPLPEIAGAVLVGTLAGEVLYTAPYSTSDGAPVAPELLKSFQLVWDALPEVLGANGAGRFDLMVRQAVEGHPEAVTYWNSGMSAGALCGLVARRVRDLRAAVYAPQRNPRQYGVTVTEVHGDRTEMIEWIPPKPVDHTEQIRQQLSAIIHGRDPFEGVRS